MSSVYALFLFTMQIQVCIFSLPNCLWHVSANHKLELSSPKRIKRASICNFVRPNWGSSPNFAWFSFNINLSLEVSMKNSRLRRSAKNSCLYGLESSERSHLWEMSCVCLWVGNNNVHNPTNGVIYCDCSTKWNRVFLLFL